MPSHSCLASIMEMGVNTPHITCTRAAAPASWPPSWRCAEHLQGGQGHPLPPRLPRCCPCQTCRPHLLRPPRHYHPESRLRQAPCPPRHLCPHPSAPQDPAVTLPTRLSPACCELQTWHCRLCQSERGGGPGGLDEWKSTSGVFIRVPFIGSNRMCARANEGC
eukprot:1144270-Pelagomonas_calceolata.AAC.21